MEILDKSSRWRRRHAPRTSFFVCIRTLKSRSAPWLTFTGSGGFSLLFSVAVFAVSRRANVTELDNPSAAFFFFPEWSGEPSEQRRRLTSATASTQREQQEVRLEHRSIRTHSNTSPWTPTGETHSHMEHWNYDETFTTITKVPQKILTSNLESCFHYFLLVFCLYLQSSHKIKTFHCVLTCQNDLNTFKLLFCFHTLESAHACAEL